MMLEVFTPLGVEGGCLLGAAAGMTPEPGAALALALLAPVCREVAGGTAQPRIPVRTIALAAAGQQLPQGSEARKFLLLHGIHRVAVAGGDAALRRPRGSDLSNPVQPDCKGGAGCQRFQATAAGAWVCSWRIELVCKQRWSVCPEAARCAHLAQSMRMRSMITGYRARPRAPWPRKGLSNMLKEGTRCFQACDRG
jgi:hypothetical protein